MSTRRYHLEFAFWLPPPLGTIKVNIDASFDMVGPYAGVGIVARHHSAAWILGISAFVEALNIVHAKLLAIRLGLQCSWDRCFPTVICETDSLEAHHLINVTTSTRSLALNAIVAEINSLLARDWHVDLQHVFREANSSIDCLARIGLANRIPFKV
ncbi:Ribonuclease H-like superfamily [Sesbania bispinosa]|nr:Ribonuclease H-like superfamily [Sesbania bispinosa]